MKPSALDYTALSLSLAAALLAGCDGAQPSIGAPSAMPQSRAALTHPDRSGSWMLPEAKSESLLYISDFTPGGSRVYAYTFPDGKLVGALDVEAPGGECVDKTGDVWITSRSKIVEYAHGGSKPIEALRDSDGPDDCSVDFASGSLAVSNQPSNRNKPGTVLIYSKAQGVPKTYQASSDIRYPNALSYDNRGNLFIDGYWIGYSGSSCSSGCPYPGFAELSRGANAIRNIKLRGGRYFCGQSGPGGVEFDGQYLAIAPACNQYWIYRYFLNRGHGDYKEQLTLNNAAFLFHFWIQDRTLVAPDCIIVRKNHKAYCEGAIMYYDYPGGGNPTKTITGKNLHYPVAAAVSLAN
ncbi:MAG: hypothetical protein WBE79_12080 [Candidatus Cybelea sp.]